MAPRKRNWVAGVTYESNYSLPEQTGDRGELAALAGSGTVHLRKAGVYQQHHEGDVILSWAETARLVLVDSHDSESGMQTVLRDIAVRVHQDPDSAAREVSQADADAAVSDMLEDDALFARGKRLLEKRLRKLALKRIREGPGLVEAILENWSDAEFVPAMVLQQQQEQQPVAVAAVNLALEPAAPHSQDQNSGDDFGDDFGDDDDDDDPNCMVITTNKITNDNNNNAIT
jgi:hypothetical protein